MATLHDRRDVRGRRAVSVLQKHKSFGLPVAAGGCVLALWYVFVYSAIRSDEAEKRDAHETLLAKAERLAAGGVATPEAPAEADLDALVARAHFALPPMVQAAIDRREGAAMKFSNDVTVQSEEFTRNGLRLNGGTGHALGFKVETLPDDVAGEFLARLAAVTQLLTVLLEAGVLDVAKIEPFDDRPFGSQEPSFAPGVFLNGARIRITFTASSKAVFAALHGLQTAEPFLAVLAFDTKQENPARDDLKTEMVVGMLRIDSSGSLGGEEDLR